MSHPLRTGIYGAKHTLGRSGSSHWQEQEAYWFPDSPLLPLLCNSTNWILSADTFRPLTSARFNLATKINDWQLDNCRNAALQWHFRCVCQSHVTFGQDRISRLFGAVISFKRNWELGHGISESRAAVARVWVSVSFVTKVISLTLCGIGIVWHYGAHFFSISSVIIHMKFMSALLPLLAKRCPGLLTAPGLADICDSARGRKGV